MVATPKIGMNLDFAADDDVRWHRDAKFFEGALAALEESGLGRVLVFERMEIDFNDPVPFDRKALAKAAAAAKTQSIKLLGKAGENVAMAVGGIVADIKGSRILPSKAALEALIAWARAVARLPEGRARARNGTVYPIDLGYPARRPPVDHDFVRLGTLVDFFGPAWLGEESAEVAKVVLEAELPEGVSRIRDDELVVLRWARDLKTAEDLAHACMRQEDFWRAHVDMTIEGGWNAEGDRSVYPDALEPGAPFTLVDRAQRTGYRAVVVMPDGTLDGASWSDIAQLTAMTQLADGTPIERVRLIVPVRENAVEITPRARELGVDAVLYKDGDTLWNPVPPGNWRDGPKPVPKPRRSRR